MDHQAERGSKIGPGAIVVGGVAVLALVALGVPLVSLLYVGVLLLCPLLMIGMHAGHGHASGGGGHAGPADPLRRSTPPAKNAGADGPPVEGGSR